MAAWQFDLYFVARGAPCSDLESSREGVPTLPLSTVYSMQNDLAFYLGPPWLMLSDWLVFGPENGNRVDVCFESETAASMFVRCDVREEAPQFLVLFSKIAQLHGCLFFNPQSGRLIEPTLEALSDEMSPR